MAIGPIQPVFQYNRFSILASAPRGSGVYALFTPQQWIYVGESVNIQARLLRHLNGDHACITRLAPTGFQYERWPKSRRLARLAELIRALHPACNLGTS